MDIVYCGMSADLVKCKSCGAIYAIKCKDSFEDAKSYKEPLSHTYCYRCGEHDWNYIRISSNDTNSVLVDGKSVYSQPYLSCCDDRLLDCLR